MVILKDFFWKYELDKLQMKILRKSRNIEKPKYFCFVCYIRTCPYYWKAALPKTKYLIPKLGLLNGHAPKQDQAMYLNVILTGNVRDEIMDNKLIYISKDDTQRHRTFLVGTNQTRFNNSTQIFWPSEWKNVFI